MKVNAAVTLIPNALAVILFPEACLKMHNYPIWIFIGIVYVLALLIAAFVFVKLFYNCESINFSCELPTYNIVCINNLN